MKTHFEAFLYLTNWGTRRLMFRLPAPALPAEVAVPFACPDTFSVSRAGEFILVDYHLDEEQGEWVSGEGWFASLTLKKGKGVLSMSPRHSNDFTEIDLDRLVEEATVDCYNDEAEQVTGLFTVIKDHLELPFTTTLLGLEVRVIEIRLTDDNRIALVCRKGRETQLIAASELPLPNTKPRGAEWLAAYRWWLTRGR